jgi:hypothetical protein
MSEGLRATSSQAAQSYKANDGGALVMLQGLPANV